MTEHRVELTDAIHLHTDWKIKLRGAISDQSTLDRDAIARDDCCQFGLWLYKTSKEKYGALSAHRECLLTHAQFHRCAADVAASINAGEYLRAELMLAAGTEYALASRSIVLAIERLRREISNHDTTLNGQTDA